MKDTNNLTISITNTQNILDNIKSFKNSLIKQSKSTETIKSYTSNIQEYYKLYSELSRDNILSFIKHLKSKNLSGKTINQKLSSLKSYNLWLIESTQDNKLHIINNDFIVIQEQKISPTKVETEDILKAFKEIQKKECFRNVVLIYLIISTGIRRFESVNIKLSDLDFVHGTVKILGKGNKERTVLLNDKLIDMLKDYISIDRKEYRYSNESEYLFPTNKSIKMSKEYVNQIFSPYFKPEDIKIHDLRHLHATRMLENGSSLPEVADQLGHGNIQTTIRYTHPKEKEMRDRSNKMAL